MRDDEVVPVRVPLEWQRDYAVRLGSPVAALILQAVLDSPSTMGLLPESVRFGSLPGLRVLAAVHRLAIDRLAPRVAVHLPTLGGTPPVDAGRPAFAAAVVESLASNASVLAEYLDRIPQTNETSRAALLRCALSRMDSAVPLGLYEFGCSAGLNLLADRLPGVPSLESGPLPPIAHRQGCDLRPVDAASPDGRALLSSYIWADDVDRWARLQAALRLREETDVPIQQADAESFIRGITPRSGLCTVIWQSAMWVYLDEQHRSDITNAIAALGASADESAPVAHVSWELADHRADDLFELVVRRWDGSEGSGEPRLLATGLSHGTGVVLA